MQSYVSKAGDSQKWPLGWVLYQDIVILHSSDVGNIAFRIENGKLIKVKTMSKAMNERVKTLNLNSSVDRLNVYLTV